MSRRHEDSRQIKINLHKETASKTHWTAYRQEGLHPVAYLTKIVWRDLAFGNRQRSRSSVLGNTCRHRTWDDQAADTAVSEESWQTNSKRCGCNQSQHDRTRVRKDRASSLVKRSDTDEQVPAFAEQEFVRWPLQHDGDRQPQPDQLHHLAAARARERVLCRARPGADPDLALWAGCGCELQNNHLRQRLQRPASLDNSWGRHGAQERSNPQLKMVRTPEADRRLRDEHSRSKRIWFQLSKPSKNASCSLHQADLPPHFGIWHELLVLQRLQAQALQPHRKVC